MGTSKFTNSHNGDDGRENGNCLIEVLCSLLSRFRICDKISVSQGKFDVFDLLIVLSLWVPLNLILSLTIQFLELHGLYLIYLYKYGSIEYMNIIFVYIDFLTNSHFRSTREELLK